MKANVGPGIILALLANRALRSFPGDSKSSSNVEAWLEDEEDIEVFLH